MCTLQLLVFEVNEKIPFESNDIEEESADNSILITLPKNKESFKRSQYNLATFAM